MVAVSVTPTMLELHQVSFPGLLQQPVVLRCEEGLAASFRPSV